MHVSKVESAPGGRGGGTYRIFLDDGRYVRATLFVRLEDGAGVFMSDDPARPLDYGRPRERWFIVRADGRVVQPHRQQGSFNLSTEGSRTNATS
jgi:hypothetical protein